MTMQWCPRCQKMQNVRVTLLEEKRVDEDNKEQKVIISNSYCAVCQSFLASSESVQENELAE